MNSTLKFIISWIMFSISMSIFLLPLIDYNLNKSLSGGLILGFFAGVLSQIEGNTRK